MLAETPPEEFSDNLCFSRRADLASEVIRLYKPLELCGQKVHAAASQNQSLSAAETDFVSAD